MDVDNQLSHAYILVERMLAGETALEDFVSSGAPQGGLAILRPLVQHH
jgi:hypothetical protein